VEKTHAMEERRGDVIPAWPLRLPEVVSTRRKAKNASRSDVVDLKCVFVVKLAAEAPTRRRRRSCWPTSTVVADDTATKGLLDNSETAIGRPSENLVGAVGGGIYEQR
jgi:hypothetical protein